MSFEETLSRLEFAVIDGEKHVATECILKLHEAHLDDRARRIKELATKWGERCSFVGQFDGLCHAPSSDDARSLLFQAARFIDAIDNAEVPEKAGAK